MWQLEEKLVDAMKARIRSKVQRLSALDRDLLLSLQRCQAQASAAQQLMATDLEPRVSQ